MSDPQRCYACHYASIDGDGCTHKFHDVDGCRTVYRVVKAPRDHVWRFFCFGKAFEPVGLGKGPRT